MSKKRKEVFSTVKAVKANARARVGQPKASRVLVPQVAPGSKAKHKTTLAETLNSTADDL